jgi:Rad3-related DNA helicase
MLERLAQVHPGWMSRPGQETMAATIDQAIHDGATVLIEGPTGTGKTLAALAPIAARNGTAPMRAMYATGTISLQQQLLGKDLPKVQQAFGRPDAGLLKGLSNFACRNKIDHWQLPLLAGALATEQQADLTAFLAWLDATEHGDMLELHPRPLWWGDVSAGAHDCLGSNCLYAPPKARPQDPETEPGYEDAHIAEAAETAWLEGRGEHPPCFGHRARRLAFRAPLIIANHHVLLYLLRYAPTRIPPLLVIDELHKLPRAAESVFGEELAEDRWFRLEARLRKLLTELSRGEVIPLVDAATAAYRQLLIQLPSFDKDGTAELFRAPAALAPLAHTVELLGKELGKIGKAPAQFANRELAHFHTVAKLVFQPDPALARWIDRASGQRQFHATPIDTGSLLAPLFAPGQGPRIGMSATLTAAGGSFTTIERACGIPSGARHLVLLSCSTTCSRCGTTCPLPRSTRPR